MSPRWRMPRRSFLAAAALPTLIPASALGGRGRCAPSERITLGFLGLGTMASSHLRHLLSFDDVEVIGVCDVWQHRRDAGVKQVNERSARRQGRARGAGCLSTVDYHELLDREDIDAVVIGTPDHWHARMCRDAMIAGKDVYCEKPLTRTVAEARELIQVARRYERVFQTGSQQRSHPAFRDAVEMVRAGRIGKVHTVRVQVGAPAQACQLEAQDTPPSLDWERWLGPAPWRPYHAELCPQRDGTYPRWRTYRDFAGGGLADMGAHHFDIAQWALGYDQSGPVKIVPPADGGQTDLELHFACGVRVIHQPGCIPGTGLRFEGELGTLDAVRWHTRLDPVGLSQPPIAPQDRTLRPSHNHQRDWVDCIRSRRRPVADVERGARTATLCALANLGYRLQRPLQWDVRSWRFIDDDDANRMLADADRLS